jgi:hypothetical protein
MEEFPEFSEKETDMKALYCDVCRKEITNPVHERNYFHIQERDLCEPCKDDLELSLKQIVREKKPFDYSWYAPLMMNTINKAVQRGKF